MRVLVACIVLMCVAACAGHSSKPAPTLNPRAIESINQQQDAMDHMPKCNDVWVTGKLLPKKYDGCKNGDVLEAPTFSTCVNGVNRYLYETTGHGYYSDMHRRIHDGGTGYADDPEYSKVIEECEPR